MLFDSAFSVAGMSSTVSNANSNTSDVTLDLTSFGKPEIQVRENGGTLNPRTQDQWSALENYEIVGKLFDYSTAHDLADRIKSASGTPLELEIPTDG